NPNSDLNLSIGQNGVSRFSADNRNQILGQDQNVPIFDRQPCLCAQPKFAKAFLRDLNELQSAIVSEEVYNQTNDDSFEDVCIYENQYENSQFLREHFELEKLNDTDSTRTRELVSHPVSCF
ncbi:hypothetical protein BpHYR1_052423, partial [Brachionus plicatilis]